jgi:hypothetical protein
VNYNFRIRVNRSDRNFINTDLTEVSIPSPEVSVTLFLRSAVSGKSIKDAEQLVLAGEGFICEAKALEAAIRFEEAFMIALAKARIGADFGDRAPKSSFTEHGLRAFFPGERRSLNNVHGLMAYPSEPKPQFVAFGPHSFLRGVTVESFTDEFGAAVSRNQRLTDRERLAFSLFNSSFFQPAADARFLLLTMAIEALIEPVQKSQDCVQKIDGFIKQIEESSLEPGEKNSLIGSLRWLRDESITRAGKRLAREKLGDKSYEGKSAPDFFSAIYSLRSSLVHGREPFPTFAEINAIAATLEVFVSDLLTAPVASS